MHVIEVNPGPDSNRLRYDFILTAAEATAFVEDIMRDVERLTVRFADSALPMACEGLRELATWPNSYPANANIERMRVFAKEVLRKMNQ